MQLLSIPLPPLWKTTCEVCWVITFKCSALFLEEARLKKAIFNQKCSSSSWVSTEESQSEGPPHESPILLQG